MKIEKYLVQPEALSPEVLEFLKGKKLRFYKKEEDFLLFGSRGSILRLPLIEELENKFGLRMTTQHYDHPSTRVIRIHCSIEQLMKPNHIKIEL